MTISTSKSCQRLSNKEGNIITFKITHRKHHTNMYFCCRYQRLKRYQRLSKYGIRKDIGTFNVGKIVPSTCSIHQQLDPFFYKYSVFYRVAGTLSKLYFNCELKHLVLVSKFYITPQYENCENCTRKQRNDLQKKIEILVTR